MQSQWSLLGLRAERRGPDFEEKAWHAFVATFDGPRGPIEVELPVEALLHFETFTRWVAVRMGFIYRNATIEGRGESVMNENWRCLTSFLLEQSAGGAAAIAQAEFDKPDPSTLN